jgi:general stress protein YciG
MRAKENIQLFEPRLSSGQEMMTVKDAGRRGGLTTLSKHGISHFRRAGAIGGKVTATRHQILISMRSMETDKRIGGKTPKSVTAQQESGRKGGLSTVKRHGRKHMSLIGKLGGRPTFEEGIERSRKVRVERSGRASKEGGIGAPS